MAIPDRRAAIDQVRNGLPWPFAVVAAAPEPEIEAWLTSGFVPKDEDEANSLDVVRRELSFDPTTRSYRLTSHPNTARTDAKRVLSRLCQDDHEREVACLERTLLYQRGDRNGARAFLEEVELHAVPLFRR